MDNKSLRICNICHHISAPKKRGSGGIEFVLWCVYLVPGLIYRIWRNSGTTCPACGSSETLPVGTPKAQEIISKAGPNQAALTSALEMAEADEAQRQKNQKVTDKLIYALIIAAVVVFAWVISLAP